MSKSEFTTKGILPTEFESLRLERYGFEIGKCELITHDKTAN